MTGDPARPQPGPPAPPMQPEQEPLPNDDLPEPGGGGPEPLPNEDLPEPGGDIPEPPARESRSATPSAGRSRPMPGPFRRRPAGKDRKAGTFAPLPAIGDGPVTRVTPFPPLTRHRIAALD